MRRPVLVLLSLLLMVPAAASPLHAGSDDTTRQQARDASVGRAAGNGRIQTAVALSQRAFPDRAAAVVVAYGNGYADALSAAPVAAAAGGPVLLNVRDRLHPDVGAEVQRLGASRAYVIGGPGVQTQRVEDDLRGMGLEVRRVADPDVPSRYGTAAAAARTAVDIWRRQGDASAGQRVLVALGQHPDPARAWPDALSAGALSGHAHWPILLVTPEEIPAITNATLRDLGAQRATVVGGPGAIPERVKENLDADRRDRIAGATRYETSVRLSQEAIRNRGASDATVVVATGQNYPDGLAAGPAAYHLGGVLVLVGRDDLVDSPSTKAWFEAAADRVSRVIVAGGKGAITDETAGQIGFAIAVLRLRAVPVADGFDFPLFATSPPGDTSRLFVVERGGEIEVIKDGRRLATPFLDLTGRVRSGGEQGLLGLAFHPRYADNGRFYVHYTDTSGDTRVAEYRRSSNPDRAAGRVREIFSVDQPYSNHNGGMLAFGRDGRLYLALGDGGGGGDPDENGQDPRTPLGSIVRLDLDRPGSWESWMHGLRNPWRFSFDPADRLVYIGDVGQGSWEEVDVAADTAHGTNFGWDVMEGRHCFEPSSGCDRSGKAPPAVEYATGEDGSCAVTGGYVYRGDDIPFLRGQYVYGDFCAGFVRSFHYHRGNVTDERDWSDQLGDVGQIPSFGTDARGEIYITSTNGTVYRLESRRQTRLEPDG